MPERPYDWDPRTGRYHDPVTRRFVTLRAVRSAIDKSLERAEKEVRAIGISLREGRITLVQWELEMRRLIKDIALYSTAAAKGGWAQLTQADLGRVGQHLRVQYTFLRDFGKQVAAGKQVLDGRFLARMVLYAREGRTLYHITEVREHLIRGFTKYKNVLHPADHCSDCVAQTEKGFVEIGELIPIGDRQCRSNDKCSYAYEGALA